MPIVQTLIKEAPGKIAMTNMELGDPGPGQALIRTTLATICGSDIHIIDDMPLVPDGTPMGHEAVGIVEAVGAGVERVKVGDRVACCCLMSCGNCARCNDGDLQVCETFGAPFNLVFGAQGEAFMVNGVDTSTAPVPDGMDDKHALLVTDVLSTGFGGMERAGLKPGQSVAIFAQGPVGLSATIGAKHYGAEPIIVVESIPERVKLAKQFGATHVVSPENAVDEIMKITAGKGVDVAVEALGKQVTFENCCRVTRLGGTVSSLGVYGGIDALSIPTDGSFIHRRIVTTFCPAGTERLNFLLGLIDKGRIDPTPMITHEVARAEIFAAYKMFRTRADGAVKVAITL